MRHGLAIALLAWGAGSATAQPITRPELPCKVTIVVAPADVRAEIEAWVRAEPRCARTLEVRVVPTDDGLYLQTRDPEGRMRERVVPDAQSAAVLVVSWMADDSLDATLPAATTQVEEPPHRELIALGPARDLEQPTGIGQPGRVRVVLGKARGGERSLSVGAMASPDERVGVRGQLDLFAGRRWRFGIAGGMREHQGHARIVLGTTRRLGPVGVRAQLGVGFSGSKHVDRMDGGDDATGARRGDVVPSAELGVLANVRVGRTWGLIGGPLIESSPDRDRPTKSMFLGVQRSR